MKNTPEAANSNALEIERKLGTPLGKRWEPRAPTLAALRARGIFANPTLIPGLRAGRFSGSEVLLKIDAAEILEQDDASKKNGFYALIAAKALEERTPNDMRNKPAHRFQSFHYLEDIAGILGVAPDAVRLAVRAMRADLVMGERETNDPDLVSKFLQVANVFIWDNYQARESLQSPGVKKLDDNWDGKTLKSFYQNLYAHFGGMAIGSWTPYEIDIFDLFFTQQIALGNHLTPLDTFILKSFVESKHKVGTIDGIVDQIKASTGIPVDKKVLGQHRASLLYGNPAQRK